MTDAINLSTENVRKIDLAVDGHTNDVAYWQQVPQREKEYAYDWWQTSQEYRHLLELDETSWPLHLFSPICNIKQLKEKPSDRSVLEAVGDE